MIFIRILRRVCSERVFSHHAFNSLFITGEFTVGKKADDKKIWETSLYLPIWYKPNPVNLFNLLSSFVCLIAYGSANTVCPVYNSHLKASSHWTGYWPGASGSSD
jgi:hypothetical protein